MIGSEFCNFLASILTSRLIRAFDRCRLLDNMTYKDVMEVLSRTRRMKIPGHDWVFSEITRKDEKVLKALGISLE